jgi:hypothetical protein
MNSGRRDLTTRTHVRYRYRPSMAIARRQPDPDGITAARIAGTASRHASRKPLDVDAAVAELRSIANGRGDLLAERA